MLAWTPAIPGMSSTTMTVHATTESSRTTSHPIFTSKMTRLTTLITLQVRTVATIITITTTMITTTSEAMRKLSPPVMFTIQVTNYILSISTVIKVDKCIARWLSRNLNTFYNSISSKRIPQLMLRNSSSKLSR